MWLLAREEDASRPLIGQRAKYVTLGARRRKIVPKQSDFSANGCGLDRARFSSHRLAKKTILLSHQTR